MCHPTSPRQTSTGYASHLGVRAYPHHLQSMSQEIGLARNSWRSVVSSTCQIHYSRSDAHLCQASSIPTTIIASSNAAKEHTPEGVLRVFGMGTLILILRHLPSSAFLQNVHMHQHVAHPPNPEQNNGLIDNISDTLLNAFTKVRKPDERFLTMRESVDRFEERLNVSERLWSRVRSRTNGEWDPSSPTYFPS